MPHPIQKRKEVLPAEMGCVKHLYAIGDEYNLQQIGRHKGCHGADISRHESQQLFKRVFLDERYNLFVCYKARQWQDKHINVHQ